MTQSFEALASVLAKASGGNEFAVRQIFCIGRTYAGCVKEMGVEVDCEAPFFQGDEIAGSIARVGDTVIKVGAPAGV